MAGKGFGAGRTSRRAQEGNRNKRSIAAAAVEQVENQIGLVHERFFTSMQTGDRFSIACCSDGAIPCTSPSTS
jgi:hypothetical protein